MKGKILLFVVFEDSVHIEVYDIRGAQVAKVILEKRTMLGFAQ